MKRVFNTLLIVSIALLAIVFATLNDSRVALDLFFWPPAERSLATWLIISFLLGLTIGGLLVYLNMWFNLRRKIRLHQQQQNREAATRVASTTADSGQETPAAISHD